MMATLCRLVDLVNDLIVQARMKEELVQFS